MTVVIFLCWLANTLFLEKYYLRSKTRELYHAYLSIKTAANTDSYESDEFQAELEKVCRRSGIAAFVIDEESDMKYVSSNGGERLDMLLYGYLFDVNINNAQILKEGTDYHIQRTIHGDNEYLEAYGQLASGVSFIMNLPLESIHESADLANRFFFYVGIIGALLGGIIIWIVTGSVIKPIVSLNEISEKMVHLDFDAKYEGHAQNEIGLLGENMNKLSRSLEKNISDLKSANNELRRDIEQKEKIDEMRREFLSNVSHELKTPIALIRGYAEGLQEGMGDDPESLAFYCDVIVDEAVKMNELVQKLLTLNQLEFGHDNVEMERFSITAMVENAVNQGKLLMQKDGITLEMEEYPEYHVWADSFKTEEVIQNYLSNACHYCAGEKKIRVSLEDLGEKIRISVFNTGNQIPEESLDRLWEKFYKVDKARTRTYGGSGVGLSIVKAIMDSMHQQYGVRNEEDGVTFWFELENADRMEENEGDLNAGRVSI
ncbi:MAG: HAMP domain-containing protein [Lachnospiraceae bacterium]|nr:HAMP domain-containing protein [Lachnospiraceae bacterium]